VNAPRLRVTLASPERILARSRGEGEGHASLAMPVLHPLLVAARPSPIGLLLDLRGRDLVQAARRGPAAAERLAAIDLAALAEALAPALAKTKTTGKARRLARRLALARGLLRAGMAPAWMVVTALPLPPRAIRAGWDGIAARVDRVLAVNEALRVDFTEARYAALFDAVAALFEAHAGIVRHLAARHAPGPARAAPPRVAPAIPHEAIFGLWYATRARPGARGEGIVFAGPAEALAAHAHGAVDLHAEVGLRVEGARVRTTVGRVMLFDALGGRVPFARVNGALDARDVRGILEDTPAAFAALCRFGLAHASASGLSIGLGDLQSPPEKAGLVAAGEARGVAVLREYEDGQITEGERYNRTIDAWAEVREAVVEALRGTIGPEHPFGALRAAGLLEDDASLGLCAGMLGLQAKPSGEIIEQPILHSLAEGLAPLEAFLRAASARAAALRTRDRHREARLLRRRLDGALGGVRVVAEDCGTHEGISLGPLLDGRRVVTPLGRRVLGRAATEDVLDPGGELLVRAGEVIGADAAARLDRAFVASVRVRSPITCRAEGGVCARCHHGAAVGAKAGLAAAREIALRAAEIVERPFSIQSYCGWGRPLVRQRSGVAGIVRHQGIDGEHVDEDFTGPAGLRMLAREGRLWVHDDGGRALEAFQVLHDDRVLVGDGERIDGGREVLAHERADDTWSSEPWGGLGVLQRWLRQRPGPDRAVLAACDGTVIGVEQSRLTGVVRVDPGDGRPLAHHAFPRGRSVLVQPGDRVDKGEMLAGGLVAHGDRLRLFGARQAAARLLKDLTDLLASSGTPIADVHLEVLVRVMFDHVRVVDGGDTGLVPGQIVSADAARAESARAKALGARPAVVETVLLGIDAAARHAR
jgi:hypothetical protein